MINDGNLRLQQIESRLETLNNTIEGLREDGSSGAQQRLIEEINGVRVDIKQMVEKLQMHTVEQLNQQTSLLEKCIETVGALHDHHCQHKSSMEQVIGHQENHNNLLEEHQQSIENLHRGVVEKLASQQFHAENNLSEMKELARQSFQRQLVHDPTKVEDETSILKFHQWTRQWEIAGKNDPGGDYLRQLESVHPDDRQNAQDSLHAVHMAGPTNDLDTNGFAANPDKAMAAGNGIEGASQITLRDSQQRKRSASSLVQMDKETNAERKTRTRKETRPPDNFLTPIVMGDKFAAAFAIIIVANTLMLGVMADIQVRIGTSFLNT